MKPRLIDAATFMLIVLLWGAIIVVLFNSDNREALAAYNYQHWEK